MTPISATRKGHGGSRTRVRLRPWALVTVGALAASSLTACAGAAGGGSDSGDGKTITVLSVNNPQQLDAQKITDKYFTKKTGIKVKYTLLPENEERDKATQDVANSSGQYDVVGIGPYEIPVWSERKWLTPLSQFIDKDKDYDADDLVPAVKDAVSAGDEMYAVPFATESTFTAYRKDLLDAKGLKMPEHPTWQQIAEIAAKVNDPAKKISGLCMRGLAGWGQNMAEFTAMLNTFGGTWFNEDWSSGVTSPEFKQTMEFYKELATKYGPKGQATLSVADCYNNYVAGTSAMWIDSSAAGPAIEDPKESKAAGKTGYAYFPTVKTKYSGWLWTWGWAIPTASKNRDAAWEYLSWVSGKGYAKDVAEGLGWSHYSGFMRNSVDADPGFVEANKAFATISKNSIANADTTNVGLQKRPYKGIQYITIPEWPDLGTTAGQQLQAVIGGTTTVDEAIKVIQAAAEKVSAAHK